MRSKHLPLLPSSRPVLVAVLAILALHLTYGAPDPFFEADAGEDLLLNLTRDRLDAGVNIDTLWEDTPFGQDGITWLQYAASLGHFHLVEYLLERGANVTTANAWGYTALHFAAVQGSEIICRVLMQAGIDPTHVSLGEGAARTPVDLARQYANLDALARLEVPLPPPPPPSWPVRSAIDDPWFATPLTPEGQYNLTIERLDAGTYDIDTLWTGTEL